VFDPIQGKLPRPLSWAARRQGQPRAIVGSAQVGGHQQDFVAQSLQRGSLKLRGQTQAFEPGDEVVGQQEQMEVGLVGEEVVGRDAAQRVIALELFDDQLDGGPVVVKAPEVERLQRQVRDQDLIVVRADLEERQLVGRLFGLGPSDDDEPVRLGPPKGLVAELGHLDARARGIRTAGAAACV